MVEIQTSKITYILMIISVYICIIDTTPLVLYLAVFIILQQRFSYYNYKFQVQGWSKHQQSTVHEICKFFLPASIKARLPPHTVAIDDDPVKCR